MFRPGTEVEVAEGETGELAARGPYTIRGYLAALDRDREAFTAEGFSQIGKVSKVTLRADIGAKLEHETTPTR